MCLGSSPGPLVPGNTHHLQNGQSQRRVPRRTSASGSVGCAGVGCVASSTWRDPFPVGGVRGEGRGGRRRKGEKEEGGRRKEEEGGRRKQDKRRNKEGREKAWWNGKEEERVDKNEEIGEVKEREQRNRRGGMEKP